MCRLREPAARTYPRFSIPDWLWPGPRNAHPWPVDSRRQVKYSDPKLPLIGVGQGIRGMVQERKRTYSITCLWFVNIGDCQLHTRVFFPPIVRDLEHVMCSKLPHRLCDA